MDSTCCNIKGQFSNLNITHFKTTHWNAHSVRSQVSQAENTRTVGYHNHIYVLMMSMRAHQGVKNPIWPIINHCSHFSFILSREIHPSRSSIEESITHTDFSYSWSINDRSYKGQHIADSIFHLIF